MCVLLHVLVQGAFGGQHEICTCVWRGTGFVVETLAIIEPGKACLPFFSEALIDECVLLCLSHVGSYDSSDNVF